MGPEIRLLWVMSLSPFLLTVVVEMALGEQGAQAHLGNVHKPLCD